MILPEFFEKQKLIQLGQQLRVDPGILEKAVHALALLGYLASSGLPFVFKGGTSLLLHLPQPRRLSIDIDIVCPANAADLDAVLVGIAQLPPFTGFEEQDRGERGLPRRRHFKFFYDSPTQRDRQDANRPARLFVLLDVVEDATSPVDLIDKPIRTGFIEVEREVPVRVPTLEALLGDKLTAFAPRTTGVPFQPANGRPCETLQVVKQLFDVAELFDVFADLPAVARAYDSMQALENGYRGSSFSRDATLIDTRNACFALAARDLRGVVRNPEADWLWDGAQRLRSHLINGRFSLDDARIAAGKVALLSGVLRQGRLEITPDALRYRGDVEAIRPLQIIGEWQVLNRMKGANPEAFFYWHKASEIESSA